MKMGTVLSPWHYEVAACHAIETPILQCSAISYCASRQSPERLSPLAWTLLASVLSLAAAVQGGTRSPLKSCSTLLRISPLPERVGHRCQSGRSCSPSRRPRHPCRTSSRGKVLGRDALESCRF